METLVREYTPEEIKQDRNAHLFASGTSLVRPFFAGGAAVLTFVDAPPEAQVTADLATDGGDIIDGYIIRKYGNGSLEPGKTKDTWTALTTLSETLRNGTEFSEWVLSLNGSWLDEKMDKYAQNIRRIALTMKGKLGVEHTIIPMVRDELVTNARKHYSEDLGVKGVESAEMLGKIKTWAMAATIMAKGALGEDKKAITDAMAIVSTTLCVVSALDYFSKFEQAYHEDVLGLEPLSRSQYAINGMNRAINYTLEKRQQQAADLAARTVKFASNRLGSDAA